MNLRKIIAGTILTSLVFTGTALAANHKETSKMSFRLPPGMFALDQKKIDVTGDKKTDIVTLYGKKQSIKDVYSSDLLLVVENGATKKIVSIPVNGGGYEAKLRIQDLTLDKVADIMISADTGGSGGYTEHHFYTMKNGNAQQLADPGLDRNNQGLFGQGIISIEPIEQNHNGTYVLQITERIVGQVNADTRAYVISTWKYNNGKWEVISAKTELPK